MDWSAPSWDLFITLFVIITVGYGFLLQRERIVVTIVAAYIAILLVNLFWPDVFGFFHGDNPLLGKYFIRANLSETQVQIGVFVLAMIVISQKGGIDAAKGSGWLQPIELLTLSALTAGLILTAILDYLPDGNVVILAEQSRYIGLFVRYHDLWYLAPIGALIFLGFRGSHRRSD